MVDRENPGNIPFVDVDYCQFSGFGYQKPTRIWCCDQIAQLASVVCDKMTCLNIDSAVGGTGRHRERLGGTTWGTRQSKRVVPPALVDYLLCAPPLQYTPKFKPFHFSGLFPKERGPHLQIHWQPLAAKVQGGGSPLKKG